MKKHTTFIMSLAAGILVWNGAAALVLSANPPEKGSIVSGLAREMGVSIPDSLLKSMNLRKNERSEETVGPQMQTQTHRATSIPASLSEKPTDQKVIQTTAEQPVASDPFAAAGEGEIPLSTENKNKTQKEIPMEIPTEIPMSLPEMSELPEMSSPAEMNGSGKKEIGDENTVTANLPESVDVAANLPENRPAPIPTPDSAAPGTVSEVIPENFSENFSESIPENIPENFSETVPEVVSEVVPANSSIGQQASPVQAPAELKELPPETPVSELPAVETQVPAPSAAFSDSNPPVEMHPAANSGHTMNENPVSVSSAPSTSSPSSATSQGSGKPGDASLEGAQLTRVSIQKKAPVEIQVGKASVWEITVKNEGKTDAVGVQIHDEIPQGTQLLNTYPAAQVAPNGEITWNVGTMPSGTMATVKMELIPTQEGEIGSVATVTTRSVASAKTVATRPLLKVETFGDASILLGTSTELSIVVSNPGTGVTRDVVLSETVPSELQFEGGAELLYKVGDLQPGESKTTKLPLTAVRPGRFSNKIVAKSAPNLTVENVLEMEVTAPQLALSLEGPGKRFLEKEGTYRLVLKNSGTASAKNVEMTVTLPPGWTFNRANNFGAFLKESRRVMWKLEELGATETATAEVVVTPVEIGAFSMNYNASAEICPAINGQKNVSVEGIAALMFQVVDSNDPIQVGEETTYTVEVMNQGSKQAENVQVAVDIPAGLQVVTCDENARTANAADGKQLLFNAIPTLGPKATKTYRFTLRGVASGDQRVAVKLSSREFQTPIVKEESTRVFTE